MLRPAGSMTLSDGPMRTVGEYITGAGQSLGTACKTRFYQSTGELPDTFPEAVDRAIRPYLRWKSRAEMEQKALETRKRDSFSAREAEIMLRRPDVLNEITSVRLGDVSVVRDNEMELAHQCVVVKRREGDGAAERFLREAEEDIAGQLVSFVGPVIEERRTRESLHNVTAGLHVREAPRRVHPMEDSGMPKTGRNGVPVIHIEPEVLTGISKTADNRDTGYLPADKFGGVGVYVDPFGNIRCYRGQEPGDTVGHLKGVDMNEFFTGSQVDDGAEYLCLDDNKWKWYVRPARGLAKRVLAFRRNGKRDLVNPRGSVELAPLDKKDKWKKHLLRVGSIEMTPHMLQGPVRIPVPDAPALERILVDELREIKGVFEKRDRYDNPITDPEKSEGEFRMGLAQFIREQVDFPRVGVVRNLLGLQSKDQTKVSEVAPFSSGFQSAIHFLQMDRIGQRNFLRQRGLSDDDEVIKKAQGLAVRQIVRDPKGGEILQLFVDMK